MMFGVGSLTILLVIGLLMALVSVLIWESMKFPVSASLLPQQTLARACSHCGAGIQTGWTHCPHCGSPANSDQKVSMI